MQPLAWLDAYLATSGSPVGPTLDASTHRWATKCRNVLYRSSTKLFGARVQHLSRIMAQGLRAIALSKPRRRFRVVRLGSVRHATISSAFACALVTTSAHGIVDQPGTLDPFWATGSSLGPGKVITPIGSSDDVANAMILQPDGKVLMAGFCFSGTNYDFCVARYLPNGTLDASWNATGKVITPIGSGDDLAFAIALQPDGKVLLAGYCSNGSNNDFCAARYLSSGALDTTWNGTGKVITPIGSNDDRATAIALQPDGKVLLAGVCTGAVNSDFCAARYLPNGTLDGSWSGTGKVITPIGSGADFANAITLQPDGKVLLAGYCDSGGSDFCAARYLPNGSLDTSWNGTGKVITVVGSNDDVAVAMALQPDGRVLLAGYCFGGTTYDFCAARYLPTGALDTSWNGSGKVITPIGSGADLANAMTVQPDGRVLLAGTCSNGTNDDFCAARYLPNGTLDNVWNGTGKVITSVGSSNDAATAVVLQPDGKVLLAGSCLNGSLNDFCSLRFDGGPFGYKNCSLDIDGDGAVIATTDALIHARIALGFTGSAVVNGITFSSNATRNTWPLIREYLVTQCGMSLVQ